MTSSVVHRPRRSPWAAIPMAEALELIRCNAANEELVQVQVRDLRSGDVIAEDVRAQHPHPDFALPEWMADEIGNLRVLGGIEARTSAQALSIPPRHCYRINTGGVVPDSADVVIPVEYTKLVEHKDDQELVIKIQKQMKSGQNIRAIGSDIAEDELLIPTRTQLGAAEVGLLAASGYTKVLVFKRPAVSMLSTGDELIDLDEVVGSSKDLAEGRVVDSNRPMLIEMFRSRGFKVQDAGIVVDKRTELDAKIGAELALSSILVTTGGVSMGDKDLLKQVLQEDLRFTIHFGRVFMKPGLPCTFAAGYVNSKKCVVFGLPGNPVSAFVSAHLFVLPMLRQQHGVPVDKCGGSTIKVKLSNDFKLDSRPEYFRACYESNAEDVPTGRVLTSNQVSSRLLSVSQANLLLKLPPRSDEVSELKSGTVVDALVIDFL